MFGKSGSGGEGLGGGIGVAGGRYGGTGGRGGAFGEPSSSAAASVAMRATPGMFVNLRDGASMVCKVTSGCGDQLQPDGTLTSA